MRLIDADKIDYRETVVGEAEFATYHTVAFKSDIEAMPTVDIKTKVARKIFAEIEKSVEDAEFEFGTIIGVKLYIAELKNKYTKEGVE